MNKNIFLRLIIIIFFFNINLSAQERALTVEDMWKMNRIIDFDISPDGNLIAFEVTSYKMEENKGNSDIFIINSDGKNLRKIKASDAKETKPKFISNETISYIANKNLMKCSIDGSGEEVILNIYSGVEDYDWSEDRNFILFISKVYPDCENQDCNKQKDEEEKNSKVKAKIFTELMYRHWNDWRGDKRSHLFLFDIKNNSISDLTVESTSDVPPISLGSKNDFNFSPDAAEAAFAMNIDKFLAASTNNDIFIIGLKNNNNSPQKISWSKGNDSQPVYSPDGKLLAFTSMKRAGFEADKKELIIYYRENGETKNLTETFENSVDEFIWLNNKEIIFNSANEIYNSVYKINLNGEIKLLLKEGVNTNLKVSPGKRKIFFKRQKSTMPAEIFSFNIDGTGLTKITSINNENLAGIKMNPVETFWTEGAEGTKVQSILVKPPFFDPSKKYPMIFLIHGGPQGHWSDDFHYRWNLQMFAANGYVVVAPNPRGSTGYGQKFTDEISLDWGGKVYTDLMNSYDYAIKNFDFIDAENTFAAGASYGGYMINWIAGHTDRFNALVSHAGVFNLESEYGTTEELWFPEWEYGGTPWENRGIYEKWSPHRYIHNAKTPVLVIHGAKDFRVPEEQAFQLFTSLQRLGVESKFLYFPDETHWVTKPLNAKLWWDTIFEWFNEHKKSEIQ